MDQMIHPAELCTLLREFRLWQDLARLTRAERTALIGCDLPGLADLAKQKSHILQALASQQQSRGQITTQDDSGWQSKKMPISPQTTLVAESETGYSGATSVSRLIAGIQSLSDQISELVQGNSTLAESTMKQVWAMQNWIQQENRKSMPTLQASLEAARALTYLQHPASVLHFNISYSEPPVLDFPNKLSPTSLPATISQE